MIHSLSLILSVRSTAIFESFLATSHFAAIHLGVCPKKISEDILVSLRISEDICEFGDPLSSFSDNQGDLLGYPRISLGISYSISVDLHDISMTSP
jgi:hypothetical protein